MSEICKLEDIEDKYTDIIDLPPYEPKNHIRMSIESRAAQFAPFSALVGYSMSIREKERLTEKEIIKTDEEKEKINNTILEVKKRIKTNPTIMIKYFIKDNKKEGGKYINERKKVKFIDEVNKCIKCTDGQNINFINILEITIEKENNL